MQGAILDNKLKSEQVVISAPMSFHGSAARIWKITISPNILIKIILGCVALIAILFAWTIILAWYLTFGLLLVPYRLVRRGQRKRKMENLRHRELLQATEMKE